jgi:hypothetical protein
MATTAATAGATAGDITAAVAGTVAGAAVVTDTAFSIRADSPRYTAEIAY